MNKFIAKARIQIELTPAAAPNPPLLDLATGMPPEFYVSDSLVFAFCIFDTLGHMLNASTLAVVAIDLLDDPTTLNRIATASQAAPFHAQVQLIDWRNQADQQALISLPADALAALDFGSRPTARLWMVVQGVTLDGDRIVLGAGWVTVRAGVPADVRLPLLPIPTVIPKGTTYFIPAGVIITFPSAPQIIGQIVLGRPDGPLPAGSFTILNQ